VYRPTCELIVLSLVITARIIVYTVTGTHSDQRWVDDIGIAFLWFCCFRCRPESIHFAVTLGLWCM